MIFHSLNKTLEILGTNFLKKINLLLFQIENKVRQCILLNLPHLSGNKWQRQLWFLQSLYHLIFFSLKTRTKSACMSQNIEKISDFISIWTFRPIFWDYSIVKCNFSVIKCQFSFPVRFWHLFSWHMIEEEGWTSLTVLKTGNQLNKMEKTL